MSNAETLDIIQLGLSGNVAEAFRAIAADPDCPLNVVAIATATQPKLHGKLLGETGYEDYAAFEDTPIVSLEQTKEIEAPVLFSGLQTDEAKHQELELAEGRWMVTNASAHRMEPFVALFNAYVGGGQLEELRDMSIPARLIAGGNCLSIENVVAIAELERQIGIQSMMVKTLQGWSGKGLQEVPEESQNSYPAVGLDEEDKINTEPNKFLGTMKGMAGIAIKSIAERGPWLRGHHARLTMHMARETSKEEIIELLEGAKRPPELKGLKYGPGSPKKRPVKLSKHDLLEGGDGTRLRIGTKIRPMQVTAHVEDVSADGRRVVMEIVGDNLILGAAGSNIMNALYAHAKGYI